MARNDLPALVGTGEFNGELIVDRILARREDWGLALCRTPGDKPHQARVGGPLGQLDGGDRVQVAGSWQTHPKYGLTLQARSAQRLGVDERGAVVDVLRAVRHVGPRKAEELVDKYGAGDAIATIDKDPEKTLGKLPGLGLVKGKEAATSWRQLAPNRPLHLLLARHRVGWLTPRLVKELGPRAMEKITADPYSLTSLHGLGVRTADAIARAVGVDPHGEQRARAVLLEVLREAGMRGGHVGLPVERAREAALALSLEPPVALPDDLAELVDGDSLVLEDELLSDGIVRRREQAVADGLARLAGSTPNAKLAKAVVPDPLEVSGKKLDGEQRAAVLAALRHPVSVATGLPGTGKTVLIEALAQLGSVALTNDDGVALAAPTGRAARRIEEATGHDASTIHRMLGWIPGQPAERGEDEPLEAGLGGGKGAATPPLDVREVLLKATPPGSPRVLGGDVAQREPGGAEKP